MSVLVLTFLFFVPMAGALPGSSGPRRTPLLLRPRLARVGVRQKESNEHLLHIPVDEAFADRAWSDGD